MEFDKVMAVIAALTGEPVDPAETFGDIARGGHHDAFPVTINRCPSAPGPSEVEGRSIICGSVRVPEDHDAPDAESHINLQFAVMKSRSGTPAEDPLLYLHGGPGSGNLDGLAYFAQVFDPWRQTRDVIMFDQRAAGLSSANVACHETITDQIDAVVRDDKGAVFEACFAELQSSARDLSKYNTLQNAYDTRAVMQTLGYETYNIYGISYGTKLALEVMRSAPDGVRSVILDGVIPPWIPGYDTLATPLNDSMEALVTECAQDTACNAAYPDLGSVLNDVLNKAEAGELTGPDGDVVPLEAVVSMFEMRAKHLSRLSITPYMPAMIYEFARGEALSPAIDLVYGNGFILPDDRMAALRAGVTVNDHESRTLLDLAISQAETLKETDHGLSLTLPALRDAVRRSRDLGPLAAVLDEELSRAGTSALGDPSRTVAMARDFAALVAGSPTAEALTAFVAMHFEGDARARLSAVIAAMNTEEIDEFFRSAAMSVQFSSVSFTNTVDLWIYACQEDIPFNSLAGFEELRSTYAYPAVTTYWTPTTTQYFAICEMFDHHPRENFQVPFASDIPTLAIGGTWDQQTSWKWGAAAISGFSDAQALVFPETGHGSVLYARCVSDIGLAFTHDPGRKFTDTCAQSLKPEFYIAPWVQ
ncbi:alpha/beta fold hydrolase [Roseobacter ponti]|uniref:Proline iminopeptidase n=1 Tax=Roseobacter ponti TaxID=1891787 RepID=A0A858SZM3_9RHOB|nr:alpha/beta fold hydrolase [Roseobacter ponti]QJF52951.1 alpha/beta fold hydrolase [Roseobacter ponti]